MTDKSEHTNSKPEVNKQDTQEIQTLQKDEKGYIFWVVKK